MSRMMTAAVALFVACAALIGPGQPAWGADPHYKFVKEIPIGGGSGWDYLSAEPVGRRLYVTHRTRWS